MTTSFCASGDLMLLEPFPREYDFTVISRFITRADVRITNLESVFSNWDCFASSYCGGQWINAEPDILDEIKKFGFNLYSCANNHSMDYSFDGLLSTIRELKKRNMPFAGIGGNLQDASRAVIYTIPQSEKKVALISITSTFIDAARAGNANAYVPGRPGVNPLRARTVYRVTSAQTRVLRDIAEKTFINGERDNARRIGSLPPEEEGSFNFGGILFMEAEEEGKFTYCEKADLNRTIREIEKLRELVDYVIVAVHSHQIKYDEYTQPDYFMEEFCRNCIDAGATAMIGGGTHQLKPVEIYKDRPIFYSLGNFVFQLREIKKLPADYWDKYHLPRDFSVSDALAKRSKGGTIGLEVDRKNYLSVIPYFEFDNDRMTRLILKPIELNFYRERALKGLPSEMNPNAAEALANHLNDISQAYGTKFCFDGEYITCQQGKENHRV